MKIYYIPQLVRALWLINFAGSIQLFYRKALYDPLHLKSLINIKICHLVSFPACWMNLKDTRNISLTSFARSVL